MKLSGVWLRCLIAVSILSAKFCVWLFLLPCGWLEFCSYTFWLLLCSLPQECPQCHQMVGASEIGVVAPKFGNRTLWHPSCFVCCVCEELLVDLTYCVHDDLLYCERHYAEQLKPRCAACDEVSLNIAGTSHSETCLVAGSDVCGSR
jgi:hypothetical protein